MLSIFRLEFLGIGVSVIPLTNFAAGIGRGSGGFDEPRKYS